MSDRGKPVVVSSPDSPEVSILLYSVLFCSLLIYFVLFHSVLLYFYLTLFQSNLFNSFPFCSILFSSVLVLPSFLFYSVAIYSSLLCLSYSVLQRVCIYVTFPLTWWQNREETTNDYLLNLTVVGLDIDPYKFPNNQWSVESGFLMSTPEKQTKPPDSAQKPQYLVVCLSGYLTVIVQTEGEKFQQTKFTLIFQDSKYLLSCARNRNMFP